MYITYIFLDISVDEDKKHIYITHILLLLLYLYTHITCVFLAISIQGDNKHKDNSAPPLRSFLNPLGGF